MRFVSGFGELGHEFDGELGVDGGGVRVAGGGGFVDFFVGALGAVAGREGDGGEGTLDGGVGGAYCSGKSVQKRAQVVAKVWAREEEVRLRAVPIVGHDVVQSEEGAARGCPVVVPDMGVVRISTEARGAFGDQAVFRRCGQVGFGGVDRSATFPGLIDYGCDDPGIVTGGVKEAVEFANVGGAETVVVVYDDVEGDGAEGEEGKERDQGVGCWETHVEGKQMLQSLVGQKGEVYGI